MSTGPHGLWYLAVLLPVVIFLAIRYYRRTIPHIPAGPRKLLLAMRLGALAALALALARPVFIWQTADVRPPVWLRLLDYSSSMDRPDGPEPGQTRLGWARALLDHRAWADLPPDVVLQTAYFTDSLAGDTAGLPREGTDIEAALRALARRPDPPAAVVLVSDGAVNAASHPADRAWPFAVYPICVGDSGLASDRAVLGIDVPALVTAGDSVRASVRVASSGEPGSATFTFRVGRHVQSRNVTLEGSGRQQEVAFHFRPDSAGTYRVSAAVAVAPDEAEEGNNRMETRIHVEPRRHRTLLLAVAPDWETAFLSRRLAANDRLDLKVAYRSLAGRGSYAGWPATYDSLAVFDLIILADLTPPLWAVSAAHFERYLSQRAGGILFLIGATGAGASWTELQQRLANVRWSTQPPGVVGISEPVRLTAAGRFHPVTRYDLPESQSSDRWGELPLLSAVVPAEIAPNAASLVETRSGPGFWPVLVAGQLGQGRTLTVLGYPLWRWDFALAASPAKRAWAAPFWNAATRWLYLSREVERLTVVPQAQPVPAFTPPQLSALLVDESWQPLSGAALVAEIADEDGRMVQTFELEEKARGRYQGRGRPLTAGDYRYAVRARIDTTIVATAEGQLTASRVSREALAPSSRPALLENLAAATGGSRLALADWPAALSGLPRQPTRQTGFRSLRLWESPWLLGLILALLGGEWVLRRRYQML